MSEYDVLPATLSEVLQQSDFVSMHAPATLGAQRMLKETHFRQMKKNAIFINTGRGPTGRDSAHQGAAGRVDCGRRARCLGNRAARSQQSAP